MPPWPKLSDRQLAILRRIGENAAPVGSGTAGLAHTVYALRSRKLVTTPWRDGSWTAEITEAGRFYLEHERYPDHLQRIPRRAAPGREAARGKTGAPARPSQPVTPAGLAAGLIEEVQQAGGTLYVADPDDETRARYRRALHAARQHRAVPEGYHLLHTGRDEGDLVIRLESDAHRDETDWNRIRLSARDLITDPGSLAARLQEDRHSVDVSDAVLDRALEIARALAGEAGRHGCQLAVSRRGKPRGLYVHARGHQFPLSISEECDMVPHAYTAEELRQRGLYPWRRVQPETDPVPSGRLRVELHGPGPDGTRHWADGKGLLVESRLKAVIKEAGRLADAAVQACQAREQAVAARQEAWRQELAAQERKDAERKAARKAAQARAREQAKDDHRGTTFSAALDAWETATRIRALCSALEQASPWRNGEETGIGQWVAWARAHADRIDPVRNPGILAGASFDIEPGTGDLEPYLDGGSPRPEPARGPQTARPAVRAEDPGSGWQQGRRGRAQWWRR
jgi:hypothetical protein